MSPAYPPSSPAVAPHEGRIVRSEERVIAAVKHVWKKMMLYPQRAQNRLSERCSSGRPDRNAHDIEIGSCISVAALPVWTMNFGGPFRLDRFSRAVFVYG